MDLLCCCNTEWWHYSVSFYYKHHSVDRKIPAILYRIRVAGILFFISEEAMTVEEAKDKVKSTYEKQRAAYKEIWKNKVFSHARRQAELNYKIAKMEHRKARSDLRLARRQDRKDGTSSSSSSSSSSVSTTTGLTAAQITDLAQQIVDLMASGTSEDKAEDEVVKRLPIHIRGRLPRKFWMPYRNSLKPRPIPGYRQAAYARDIDPVAPGTNLYAFRKPRSIDPRLVRPRIIDPIATSVPLPATPQGFSATRAEAQEIVDENNAEDSMELAEASKAIVESQPFYMSNWFKVGALAVAAGLIYQQSQKKKSPAPAAVK